MVFPLSYPLFNPQPEQCLQIPPKAYCQTVSLSHPLFLSLSSCIPLLSCTLSLVESQSKNPNKMILRSLFLVVLVLLLQISGSALAVKTCSGMVRMKHRRSVFSLRSFGARGDGRTLNTDAFARAVSHIREANKRSPGGSLLYVPSGVWITGPFNLTSHMTLFLAKNAVIKASQDTNAWRLVAPLPSYGRGRERPGGRYISFIHADSVEDVVITGRYGTIDGQGEVWWNMWRNRSLKYTRGNLIEIMNSKDVIISNVVLLNSPFWTIHPVYCSNVVIRGVTIWAPQDSPNTDGIDPDSSSNVCIEDCQISNGDDVVAIKSGWDEYGIRYGRPSENIVVRRVTGQTKGFSGIAIGSETSGGIRNVLVEDVHIHDSAVGFRLKTNEGRGGVISNITVSGLTLVNVRTAMKFSADTGDHPDEGWDRNALPVVRDVAVMHVVGTNINSAGTIQGLSASPMSNICLYDVSLKGPQVSTWRCKDTVGHSLGVSPAPCVQLQSSISKFCHDAFHRR